MKKYSKWLILVVVGILLAIMYSYSEAADITLPKDPKDINIRMISGEVLGIPEGKTMKVPETFKKKKYIVPYTVSDTPVNKELVSQDLEEIIRQRDNDYRKRKGQKLIMFGVLVVIVLMILIYPAIKNSRVEQKNEELEDEQELKGLETEQTQAKCVCRMTNVQDTYNAHVLPNPLTEKFVPTFRYRDLTIPEYKDIRGTKLWYEYKRYIITSRGNRCNQFNPTICPRCGIELHHITEVQNGGSNRPENLEVLCEIHHALQHPHRVIEMRNALNGWKNDKRVNLPGTILYPAKFSTGRKGYV